MTMMLRGGLSFSLLTHLDRDAEREWHGDEDEDEGEHGEEHGADSGPLRIGCKRGRRKTIRMRRGKEGKKGWGKGGKESACCAE